MYSKMPGGTFLQFCCRTGIGLTDIFCQDEGRTGTEQKGLPGVKNSNAADRSDWKVKGEGKENNEKHKNRKHPVAWFDKIQMGKRVIPGGRKGVWWSDEQTENWWMDHCITGRWDNGQREGSVDRWMCEHNAWRMDRSWLDRQMSLVMDGWMDEEMDSLMY